MDIVELDEEIALINAPSLSINSEILPVSSPDSNKTKETRPAQTERQPIPEEPTIPPEDLTDFEQILKGFEFEPNEKLVDENGNPLGLRQIVMQALEQKGGVSYLKRLDDKEFVKLLTSVIPAELKVKHEIRPHEEFLKLLANHPKVMDVNTKEVKALTSNKVS
jgi:hypothetical protein